VRRLDVYVAAHCLGSTEARRLAGAAAACFPDLRVRVVDLDRDLDGPGGGAPPPGGVVAVPTYVLDGRVVALGNPAPEQLFARLARPPAPARPGAPG
jgi:putative intracellular protease/amidase